MDVVSSVMRKPEDRELRWFGHIARMKEEWLRKNMLYWSLDYKEEEEEGEDKEEESEVRIEGKSV
jgi:hypothetical protein